MRRPSAAELERLVRRELGTGWEVAVATEPLEVQDLTTAETAAFEALPAAAARRSSWLRGRRALRVLAGRTGRCPDTAALVLPSPRLSLTHSDGVAVAVATDAADADGTGVDLEWRRPTAQAARFFLDTEEEHALLADDGEPSRTSLQRLWTVKEAVFKADLTNAGRQLRDYRVVDPRCSRGEAHLRSAVPRRFSYRSLAVADGFLTLAHRRTCHA